MKSLLLPLLLAVSLLIPQSSQGSHFLGGEISWECLNNGRYVFQLKVYRECTGIPYVYQNINLEIVGNPLPRSTTNNTISSILMRPDSGRWIASNYGDLSPKCDSSSTARFLCSASDPTIQQFFFHSDPLILQGTPPSTGWNFYITGPCCRPISANLALSGTQIFRAVMYQHPSNTQCNNSSPQFAEIPRIFACRGDLRSYNESGKDIEGDSLVYDLDTSYNIPITIPQPIPYRMGYSASSPTPDIGFDSNNVAYSYNAQNGDVRFRVNNGVGVEAYHVVRRIDEYRNSVLMSSIFREIPIKVLDCPRLNNNRPNDPPVIASPFFNGRTFINRDTVFAGDLLTMNLAVTDTNTVNGNFQEITIEIVSDRITDNYSFSGTCFYPTDTACAYIPSVTATFDSTKNIYQIKRTANYSGQIIWQTDCQDLTASMGPRTHRFYITAKDNLCPIPAESNSVFEITVLPPVNPPCQMITSTVDRENLVEDLTIFPNPSNGLLFIEGRSDQNLRYHLFDLQGKLVKDGQLPTSQRQLTLPEEAGVYFLKLMDGEGNAGHFKVVKN